MANQSQRQQHELPRYKPAKYWIGDIVYLRVRDERVRGMVTGVNIRPTGIGYSVDWPTGNDAHFEIELSSEFVPDYGADDGGVDQE